MGDKFAPLGEDEEVRNTPRGDEWTPIVPVPDGAPKALAAIDAFARFKGMSRTGLWKYTDAEGRLLAFMARFDHPPNGELREKEFRQFTFCGNVNGRREWRNKSLPIPRPLFGLARLAKNPGAPVLIVEGEKTASAATCFPGHVAITSSHGAKSAKTADWSPLAGRDVVIWPDHDKTGKDYAADVAGFVSNAGARSVRIVTVPPDFPDGWDLADKAPEGVNLRALLDAAAPWRNGPDARAPEKPPSRVVGAGTFMRSYEAISYTVDGVLPSGCLYGLTAKPGTGKTACMITATLAVETGREDILGCAVERGRVAYVTIENPVDFKMKLTVNCYFHNISFDEIEPRVAIIDGRDTPEQVIEGLKLDAESNGPFQLVCFDTFAAGFAAAGAGGFNENADVLKYVGRLRPLTVLPGLPSVLVAFHPTKNALEAELIPYGGGATYGEIDGNLTLWKDALIKFHWNRVRGPEFEPKFFRIEKLSCPDIVDKQGRQIPLPVMRPTAEADAEERKTQEGNAELALLKAMIENEEGSQREWAFKIGKGQSSVGFLLKKLEKGKYVSASFGKWRVSTKGRNAVKTS